MMRDAGGPGIEVQVVIDVEHANLGGIGFRHGIA
jgi:hypothetical protein